MTLLSGCASMLCGTRQDVAIDSRPRGAEVLVYDSHCEIVLKEQTPCVAKLERSKTAHYIVLIKKEGFAPVQVPLTGKINGAYWANILFGGIGLVIDPMTGAMWTLTPETIDGEVVRENAGFFDHEPGLLICLKEQVPKDLVGYLQPVPDK